jgi:hypothetical protein
MGYNAETTAAYSTACTTEKDTSAVPLVWEYGAQGFQSQIQGDIDFE